MQFERYNIQSSGPKATFNLVFIGLGWPWVGELVCFIIVFIFTCFPTRHDQVNRKTPQEPVFSINLSVDEVTVSVGKGTGKSVAY